MLKTFPLSDTGEMDKKKTDQLIDSIDAPTGMTITIGQIYSAYVNQLQRRVNLYATAFFKTVTDQILVATRPIGSTDRLLYMPDELGPPDASKEKLPPSNFGFDGMGPPCSIFLLVFLAGAIEKCQWPVEDS